jgi:hypothetical protein
VYEAETSRPTIVNLSLFLSYSTSMVLVRSFFQGLNLWATVYYMPEYFSSDARLRSYSSWISSTTPDRNCCAMRYDCGNSCQDHRNISLGGLGRVVSYNLLLRPPDKARCRYEHCFTVLSGNRIRHRRWSAVSINTTCYPDFCSANRHCNCSNIYCVLPLPWSDNGRRRRWYYLSKLGACKSTVHSRCGSERRAVFTQCGSSR